MAYHYLWLEASYVFGALDCQLAARGTCAVAGGADRSRNSAPRFRRCHAGHHRDRGSKHHHRADSAIHRVADHRSHPGPVPLGSECLPPETGVDVHAGLPDRRVPQRFARLPGADGPRYRSAPRRLDSIRVLAPSNPAELAESLRDAAAAGRTIALAGNPPNPPGAGRVDPADVALTTLSLRDVLEYEPRDLTISVTAGLSWCERTRLLAEIHQMVQHDP